MKAEVSFRIRSSLKKVPFVYFLNAALKARHNTTRMALLYRKYQEKAQAAGIRYSESEMKDLVRERLARRGIISSPSRGRMRIFWVGSHYEQDMSGFLKGLESFGEVVTFRNARGMYGLEYPDIYDRRLSSPDVVKRNSDRLLLQVEEAHRKAPIHVLMGQMWANVLDADALVGVQRMGISTVNISMDDKLPVHWDYYKGRRMGSVGLTGGLDLVLTTSPDTCPWYVTEGCPAIYWPLASDPELFYPRPEKVHDVVFVGGKYGSRGKLVHELTAAGIKVDAFGPGWPNGFIDAKRISEVFGQAKIILGSGYVGYNTNILTIKLRDFDATMSGALYITNRNPDLLRLFGEGDEIECYDTIDECVRKVKFYLGNPDRMEAIAEKGLARARERYTWEMNIATSLKILGFLQDVNS
jgi:hypothetical protein